jgi:uncharacterized BrkB/YihY/UPF0761 family membrane protein
VWFYWSGFMILLGAEVNSEIIKVLGEGTLPVKESPEKSASSDADLAA